MHILLNRVAIFAHLMKRACGGFVPSTSGGCWIEVEGSAPSLNLKPRSAMIRSFLCF
jgi:hypothetical protein